MAQSNKYKGPTVHKPDELPPPPPSKRREFTLAGYGVFDDSMRPVDVGDEPIHVREVLPCDADGPEGWTVVSMNDNSVLLRNHYGKRRRYFFSADDFDPLPKEQAHPENSTPGAN